MRTGIIWLASFPKSGNTWLRAFLRALLVPSDGPLSVKDIEGFCLHDSDIAPYEDYLGRSVHGMTYDEVRRLRPAVQRFIVDRLSSRVLIKTHSDTRDIDGSAALNADVTAGAIVVVRNPLDIVASHADHYGVSLEQAANDITRPRMATGTDRVPVHLGSWGSHTVHWTGGDLGFDRLIVRYEDMHAQPLHTFGEVARYLGVTDAARVQRAIDSASFSRLRRSESEVGFSERSPKARRFFRQGRSDAWRAVLPDELVAQIVDCCRDPMAEIGYLDAHGAAHASAI